MSWAFWGSLIGAGASILFAPFTGGASLAAVPKFLLLAGAGAALGAGVGAVANNITSKFGDTPKTNLAELGVDPEKLHEEAKKHREDRRSFLEEKNKDDSKDIENLDEKLKSLDESIKKMQVEVASIDDSSPEKAKKLAQLNNMENERNEVKKQRDEKQRKIDDRNERIDGILKSMSDPYSLTAKQYNQQANKPYWDSWKNWGIIAACIVVFLVILGFLKKILASVLKSTN